MDRQKTLEREARCIQEEPPACTASCPVHVDVRGLVAKLRDGDPEGALAVFSKTIPFPRIIARVCDQPCLQSCKRREVDEAVAIRHLERACIEHAAPPPSRTRPPPRKAPRVAVVGGGLSGLTAAFDLAAKGYQVVLHEAAPHLGGRLRSFPEAVLPQADVDAAGALLEPMGVTMRLGQSVASLEALTQEFAAVYLGTGPQGLDDAGTLLTMTADGRVEVDPLTFGTSHPRIFSGGGRRRGAAYSPIGSLADGRFAAVSIDRLLQDVSITAVRDRQGPFVTRLFTRTTGVPKSPATQPADPTVGFTPAEAHREAQRCLSCECLECVKVCPYLEHYGSHPRRYIREIATNADLKKGDHTANRMINSCALCGLCEAVCPEKLAMGEVCLEARVEMVDRGKMPPSAHDFALRDMAFSRSDEFTLARHGPGTTSSAAVFFPGCQLSASAPQHVMRVYEHLSKRLPGGVALQLGCCGAPADWAGRRELFTECLGDLTKAWERLGSPRVITACSSCYRVFADHLPATRVESLWSVLEACGLPDDVPPARPGVLAIHDPCATRHERPVQDAVRTLLTRLGVAVEELPLTRELTTCCGYGGLVSFANQEVADKLVDRRISTTPADFVTYCAMCRDNFARRGKPSLHLLDLVFGPSTEDAAARKGPGFSQRHENRARLKATVLREVWGETQAKAERRMQLSFSAEVLARMEERMILKEDVERTVRHAEETGARFIDPSTGHLLANHRPVAVTYWVEYAPSGSELVVHDAYSHRMDVRGAP